MAIGMGADDNDGGVDFAHFCFDVGADFAAGGYSSSAQRPGLENGNDKIITYSFLLIFTSPVFQKGFLVRPAKKSPKNMLIDIENATFKNVLIYIYTDKINLSSFDQVCEVCYAAKKYMIPPLVKQCTAYIWSDIHYGNVCRAYEFDRLFEEPELMDKCLQIMQKETHLLINDRSFEEIEIATLKTLLQQEKLSVKEDDLFLGSVRWAEQECQRQALEPTPTNKRKVLGDSITLIRFLSLTPAEFANGPAASGLLNQDECYTLLMNISSPGCLPLPQGFSPLTTSRQPPPPQRQRTPLRGDNEVLRSLTGDELQQKCVYGGPVQDILVNEQLVDCALSFSVDRNVCIYGIEMPTQLLPVNLASLPAAAQQQQRYSELIYAFLQDADNCRLTYTHYTGRVPWNGTMENCFDEGSCSQLQTVIFNRPVYILANKWYKIGVVLNKVGRYPLYATSPSITVDHNTTFLFGQDRQRDGLIKSIIFSFTTIMNRPEWPERRTPSPVWQSRPERPGPPPGPPPVQDSPQNFWP
ncbi:unnamed protein product, partial [Meganyctiphanes norvegica]